MITSGRAAQRSSFSHYRAELLFNIRMAGNRPLKSSWLATIHEGQEQLLGEGLEARRQRVREGIVGPARDRGPALVEH